MLHIPHSRPTFSQSFQDAVQAVVASGKLAQGETTKTLEHDIKQLLSIKSVLAVDSGTSALMLAIRALTHNKIGARVGIPSYTCASLLFAVKAAGAMPVFMDCTVDLTLDAKQAHNTAKTLDVLVLVHPFGMVEPLAADAFPCSVIEDIAQSVGATLHGKPVGSFADICIGSHYATKPWGGAYGGFIASHDEVFTSTCQTMINPDVANLSAAYVGHHQLSNIHAALATQRLSCSAQEAKQRKLWAEKYDAAFSNVSTATPIHTSTNSTSNHFRYLVRCEHDAELVLGHFHQLGIAASRPVQQCLHHSQSPSSCPQAEQAWQSCISIPLLADMNDAEWALMQQGIQTCFHS